MKVEINVDETQFKDILDKELKDLPKEVIQDVIVESIKGYFEQNNYENVQKLFIREINSYSGYSDWTTTKTTTEFLNKLAQDCDYSGLQSVVDEAIKSVKENHMTILCRLISEIFTTGLMKNYNFQCELERAITDTVWKINSQNQRG